MYETISLYDRGALSPEIVIAKWEALHDEALSAVNTAEGPRETRGLRIELCQAVAKDLNNIVRDLAGHMLEYFRRVREGEYFDDEAGRHRRVHMSDVPLSWRVADLVRLSCADRRAHWWWEQNTTDWLEERLRRRYAEAVFDWLIKERTALVACALERVREEVEGGWEPDCIRAFQRLCEGQEGDQRVAWYEEDPLAADRLMQRLPSELDEQGDVFWMATSVWAGQILELFGRFSVSELVALGDIELKIREEEAQRQAEAARQEREARRVVVAPLLSPLVEDLRKAARLELGHPLPNAPLGEAHLGPWVASWLIHHAPAGTPWEDLPLITSVSNRLLERLRGATKTETPPPETFAVEATVVLALAREHGFNVTSKKTSTWQAAFFACLQRHNWTQDQLRGFVRRASWLPRRLEVAVLTGAWRTPPASGPGKQ